MEANKIMYKWMPVISEDCNGCGLCVEACGPNSLEMQDGAAVLALPDTCGSEEHCIGVCQVDAIQMAWLPFDGNESRGQWRDRA
jgi:NAD-dependent dihydropyrimidine dehydrogenase PreA subunit